MPSNSNSSKPDFSIENLAARLPRHGALIGLDVGTKTIGIAFSDIMRMVATASHTLKRKKFSVDAAELIRLMNEREVAGIVIGLPINFNNTEGPRAQSCRAFARNLSQLAPHPIALWDERLSTAAAERALIEADTSRKKRAQIIDAVAATYILQGALDRLTNLASEQSGNDE